MKKLLFPFFLVLTANLSAQKTKEVSISPFLGVKVYSGIHVKLIPSDTNKMVISGENISTVVFTLKKDLLKIRHSIDQLLNPSNTYIELHFTESLDVIHTYQGSTIESTAELQATSISLKAHEGSKQSLSLIHISEPTRPY